jgi:nucleotide-binding universal stress UspA family protein
MKQNIVVGIDGSANSDAALDWAVSEATGRKLCLHLFSAGNQQLLASGAMYIDPLLDASLRREALVAADKQLAAAAARARRLSPLVDITTSSAADGAASGLVRLSSDADSIVLGRSGHGSLVGTLLGSVAMQLVAHAHCPVVLVHKSTGDVGVSRGVVVGVDGSSGSELALAYAFERASWRGVPLRVVHAWAATSLVDAPQDVRDDQFHQVQLALSETMVGWAEKYPDVEVLTSLPKDVSPVSALADVARDAELLVVGSRGRGGFRSLLLGAVSQGVVTHATCTVAVVRDNEIKVAL